MLETLRSYWSIISTIITVVAVPAVGYLYKKYKLRTPLCKISSTGEIEQRFRLN